jgi:PPE-repeat protein
MAAAAAPYLGWLSTTAEQANQAAIQARSAAAAYDAAFAATVPPPLIAQNRALLMSLVATNILGQSTPAIAATEAQYAEMWAQDATAMYAYAGASAAASALTPFTPPQQNTNPARVGAQATVVAQVGTLAPAAHSQATLSQLISTVPKVCCKGSPRRVSSGASTWLKDLVSLLSTVSPNMGTLLSALSGGLFNASGVMYIVSALPAAQAPVAAAAQGATLAGWSGSGVGTSGSTALGGAALPTGLSRTAAPAILRRAASINALSVPQTWAGAVPAIGRAATALPEAVMVGMSEAGTDGLGPWYSGMPLMGGVAAERGGGGVSRRGGGAAARYGFSPIVMRRSLARPTHARVPKAGRRRRSGVLNLAKAR